MYEVRRVDSRVVISRVVKPVVSFALLGVKATSSQCRAVRRFDFHSARALPCSASLVSVLFAARYCSPVRSGGAVAARPTGKSSTQLNFKRT